MGKRSYKDTFGRFFTEERLCRVQVEDDHTDNSAAGFQEDTFFKSPIECFRRNTYTVTGDESSDAKNYIPSDYANEGLLLMFYDDGNTGTDIDSVWTDRSTTLTNSDGTITLPSNHLRKFSNPWTDRMYQGTQNTNPGFQQSINYQDLSTASFYSVKVTGGENQIYVRSGNPAIDGGNNRIIYDN